MLLLTLATQLLLNDSQQRTIVTNGLESIAKLIRRFSEVENFYLRKTQHRLCEDLEEALSTLYFHILEFEARSVCQFDRNTASQTGRNIIKADGWQDILNAIEKSETTCNILARIIDTETQHKWNDQIEALISEQTSKVDKILKLSEQSSVHIQAQFARNNIFKEDSTIFDLDSNEAKCLALFRTTDYEFDKNKNPTRLEGTCEWFLKHPIYQKWYQNNSLGWLWVTANPGCGKSVLARSLVDEFCEKVKEPRTCYFFFKDDTEKNRSVNHALCAILHQLIYRDRALLRYAMDAYHSNGKQLPDLIEPLWKILLSILEALQEPVICILDALDECSESSRIVLIQKLAALFSNEPNSPKLKVLMTSRPNTVVENAIWDHGINPVSIQLTGEREVESQAISEEIDVYIAAKIRHFKELREYRGINDEAHETLHEKLRGIENRTYLWVSLIFPELELHAGVSEAKLLGLIKQVPTTVQEAYEKILNRSLDARRARLLLHIVVAAYQPLTLTEMNIALAVQDHSDPMEDLDTEPTASFEVTVRELCGLFIMVKDAKIYLIHQTAKEFLAQVDEQEHAALADLSPWNWRYSFNPADSHRIVARTCMLYLYLSYLRRKKTEEEMTVGQFQHMKTAWDSFSKYTKKSWMKHFSEAGFSGTTGIESSIAGICATPSIKKTLTWAQLYKSASSWSSSPESYVVKVNFNALNMASFHGHADMVNRFLKTYTATEKGIPSIRWALQNNHTTVAHALLDTIPSDSSNGHILNAAFHIACSAGEETIVSRLLTYYTVNPCHPDSLGRTALFWAARAGRKVVVQQLIKVREQHHWPKDDVGSLLLIAAFHGFGDVVHLLKSYGPAESSKFRIAALYQAISRDHACVMQALLEDHGSIAISRSELERLIIVALTYSKQASIDVLLQYSFNVNARDAHGQTTLFLAADKTIKDKLINMGADVNAIASLGWNQCYEGVGETLLYRAVASGDYEFAQLLLRHGADVNVRCRDGQTAIFTAVAAANFELVLLLLDAGANPTIKNQYGLSPVQMVGDVSCSTLKRMKTSEHQMELLALMDHAAHKHGEQIEGTNDAMRLRNLIPNPQSYHELLQEDSESIDWETFAQILEMDEPDDDNDHHFSRELVSNFFQQYQGSIIAEAKDLLYANFSSQLIFCTLQRSG